MPDGPPAPRPEKAYYVTTPIYYVNDAPHIGHAYTTVAGDVLTRWHRQRGEDVWYLTGTDEHGAEGAAQAAEAQRRRPRRSGPTGSSRSAWKPVLETIDVANDDFIRTTEQRHTTRVQTFWQTLLRRRARSTRARTRGRTASAARSSSCRASCSTARATTPARSCARSTARPVEMLSEKNYFFRLSDVRRRSCWRFYEANPTFVQPESARNEVLQFVEQGLQDLSISAVDASTGASRCRGTTSTSLYVWIDALLNYATAVGLR